MAAAMAMLVDAVKTKETISASQLSAVSKMNSFGCYESAGSDMGSMIDDQSLFPISGSSASLRPIKQRRSDPKANVSSINAAPPKVQTMIQSLRITSGNRS